MEKFIENYLPALVILIVGLLFIAYGVICIMYAASNIYLLGIAPIIIGLALIGMAVLFAIY